jgi:type VI secretion system protein VasD
MARDDIRAIRRSEAPPAGDGCPVAGSPGSVARPEPMRKLLPVFAWILVLHFQAGCGAAKVPAETAPAPIDVTITGDAKMNPDDREQSLPTVVRLYQLRSAGKLENAEFDQLYRQPKDVLGEDLIMVEEVVLAPGTTVRRQVERDRAAKVLAAVAVVRRPSGKTWRAVVDLPPPGARAEIAFVLDGYRIRRK